MSRLNPSRCRRPDKALGHIAAVLTVTCWVLSGCSHPTGYDSTTVALGDVRDVVPAVGMVKPLTQIEVRAQAPGRVMVVLVEPNTKVSAGQILARIKPDRLALDVEAAEAELRSAQATAAEAKARAEQATRSLSNRRTLSEKGFVSPSALIDAEAAAEAANATVRRAEADAARASIQVRAATGTLDDVLVRAPSDGFVMSRGVEPGQIVSPTAETPLFVIVSDTETVLIEAQVAEPDISRITPDARIAFTVEAYPRQKFVGRLRQVLRSPHKDRNFVSYPVLIEADNSDGKLFPGMTASVEFVHADARQVLRVPVEAIYFSPSDYTPELSRELERTLARRNLTTPEAKAAAEMGTLFAKGQQRVFVLEDGRPRMRAIRVGAQSSDFVEVTEGLMAGESIISGEPKAGADA